MKINQTVPASFSGYENRSNGVQATVSYKIGQILEATVLSNSSNGQVSLRLGHTQVTASTNVALQQNTHLLLKIVELQPQLLLRVMPSGDSPLIEAMRNLLPGQTSLAPVLAELAQKIQAKQSHSTRAPLSNAVHALLSAVPARSDIKQADGLKQAILQSGLFLEAKLANPALLNTADLSRDLKVLLLRYSDQLKQAAAASSRQNVAQSSAEPGAQTGKPGKHHSAVNAPEITHSTASSALAKAVNRSVMTNKPIKLESTVAQMAVTPQNSKIAAYPATQSTLGQKPPMQNASPMTHTTELAASTLLKTLQQSAAGFSAAGKSFDPATLQAALNLQTSDIPPPLKGHLPAHHPRALHDSARLLHDDMLNSPAMFKKIQGALARLGLLQVATAENFNDGQQLWQLELPVRQGNAIEIVSLTLEKEAKKTASDESDETGWSVNLSLDLPQLGPLQSRISMDSTGLSTTFWSDKPETLSIIENRLAELRANLERHGLTTHQMSCRAGQQNSSRPAAPDSPLIDYQI